MTSGRWLRRRSRTTSQRLPTAPAFSSYAPNTSLATRASTIAPAHIVQGSSVTTSVQPSSRHDPRVAAACRSATTSAWPVGSWSRSRTLRPWPMTSPLVSMTTAPMGTSPVERADRASARAACMRASYAGLTGELSRGRETDGLVEQLAEPQPPGHVGQHLVGVEVEVVEQHAHVHGAHAEVAEQVEVARGDLLVLVLGGRQAQRV